MNCLDISDTAIMESLPFLVGKNNLEKVIAIELLKKKNVLYVTKKDGNYNIVLKKQIDEKSKLLKEIVLTSKNYAEVFMKFSESHKKKIIPKKLEKFLEKINKNQLVEYDGKEIESFSNYLEKTISGNFEQIDIDIEKEIGYKTSEIDNLDNFFKDYQRITGDLLRNANDLQKLGVLNTHKLLESVINLESNNEDYNMIVGAMSHLKNVGKAFESIVQDINNQLSTVRLNVALVPDDFPLEDIEAEGPESYRYPVYVEEILNTISTYAKNPTLKSKKMMDFLMKELIEALDREFVNSELAERIRISTKMFEAFNMLKEIVNVSFSNPSFEQGLLNSNAKGVNKNFNSKTIKSLLKSINSYNIVLAENNAQILFKAAYLASIARNEKAIKDEKDIDYMKIAQSFEEYQYRFERDESMLSEYGTTLAQSNNEYTVRIDQMLLKNNMAASNETANEFNELQIELKKFQTKMKEAGHDPDKVSSLFFENKSGERTGFLISKYSPEPLLEAENFFRNAYQTEDGFQKFFEKLSSQTTYSELLDIDNPSGKMYKLQDGLLDINPNDHGTETDFRNNYYAKVDAYIDYLASIKDNGESLFSFKYLEELRHSYKQIGMALFHRHFALNMESTTEKDNTSYDIFVETLNSFSERNDIAIYFRRMKLFYEDSKLLTKGSSDYYQSLADINQKANALYKFFIGFEFEQIKLKNVENNYSKEYKEIMKYGPAAIEFYEYSLNKFININKELGIINGYSRLLPKIYTNEVQKNVSEKFANGDSNLMKQLFEDSKNTLFEKVGIGNSLMTDSRGLYVTNQERKSRLSMNKDDRSESFEKTLAFYIMYKNKIKYNESVAAEIKGALIGLDHAVVETSRMGSKPIRIKNKIVDALMAMQGKTRHTYFEGIKRQEEEKAAGVGKATAEKMKQTFTEEELLELHCVGVHDDLRAYISTRIFAKSEDMDRDLVKKSFYDRSFKEPLIVANEDETYNNDKFIMLASFFENLMTNESIPENIRNFYKENFNRKGNPLAKFLIETISGEKTEKEYSLAGFFGLKDGDSPTKAAERLVQLALRGGKYPGKEKFDQRLSQLTPGQIISMYLNSFEFSYTEAVELSKIARNMIAQEKSSNEFVTIDSVVSSITSLTAKTYLSTNFPSFIAETSFGVISLINSSMTGNYFGLVDAITAVGASISSLTSNAIGGDDMMINRLLAMVDRNYLVSHFDTNSKFYQDLSLATKAEESYRNTKHFMEIFSSMPNKIFKRALLLIAANKTYIKVKDSEGKDISIRFSELIDSNGELVYKVSPEHIARFVSVYEKMATDVLVYNNDYTKYNKNHIWKAIVLFKSFMINIFNNHMKKDGYNVFTDEKERGLIMSFIGDKSVLFNDKGKFRGFGSAMSVAMNAIFNKNDKELKYNSDIKNIKAMMFKLFVASAFLLILSMLEVEMYEEEEKVGIDEDGNQFKYKVRKARVESFLLYNLLLRMYNEQKTFVNPNDTVDNYFMLSFSQIKLMHDYTNFIYYCFNQEIEGTGPNRGEYKFQKYLDKIIPIWRSYKQYYNLQERPFNGQSNYN